MAADKHTELNFYLLEKRLCKHTVSNTRDNQGWKGQGRRDITRDQRKLHISHIWTSKSGNTEWALCSVHVCSLERPRTSLYITQKATRQLLFVPQWGNVKEIHFLRPSSCLFPPHPVLCNEGPNTPFPEALLLLSAARNLWLHWLILVFCCCAH